MKRTIYLVFIFFGTSSMALGQTNLWSKGDQNTVFSQFLEELASYSSLSNEQKENLALCSMKKITETYSSVEYNNIIEIEWKRIKKSTLDRCSGDLGINLVEEARTGEATTSSDWTKEGRSNLYNEVMNVLGRYELSAKQMEDISLCFVNDLTTKHTKKEMDEMIDAELKQSKTRSLNSCVAQNNATLKKKEVEKNEKLTIKSFTGCWESYDFSACFYENGEMETRLDKGLFKRGKGKWFLDADKIVFVSKEGKVTYKVVFYSGESIKLEELESKNELHFTRTLKF